eukprot:Rmarinus@m.26787
MLRFSAQYLARGKYLGSGTMSRLMCTGVTSSPWTQPMTDKDFKLMRDILAAPSPVGLEGAMTYGVIKPYFESFMPSGWKIHQFKGHAGIVLDTAPGDSEKLTVMIVGHADKIRMQVRSIGSDGKIWINSDSMMAATLLGNEVTLFSEDPKNLGKYRKLSGGTIEALGAIHFAEADVRLGKRGVSADQLYLELQLHGDERKKQVESLGIRPGDPILLNRPIRYGFSPNTFQGAYLDNGLGCFVTAETARLFSENADFFKNVRCLFTIASYEEIGRFGSRVLASAFSPDCLIAVDVNHDYDAAPGLAAKKMQSLTMGKGFTLSAGAITSEALNNLIETAATESSIPYQRDVVGRDTGTDAMAGVLGNVDSAAASIGIPVRNMHTISETGHTGDVLCAVHGLYKALALMQDRSIDASYFRNTHPRLDNADVLLSSTTS